MKESHKEERTEEYCEILEKKEYILHFFVSGDHDKMKDGKIVDAEMEKVLGMRREPKKDQ